MMITRSGSTTRMGTIAILILLAALSRESQADSECPGKGSTGCWASACVFTPEALFIDGGSKDARLMPVTTVQKPTGYPKPLCAPSASIATRNTKGATSSGDTT